MAEEFKTIKVDRNRWSAGCEGNLLLNSEGCMCIMGWVLDAYGVRSEDLYGTANPEDLCEEDKDKLPEVFYTTAADGDRFIVRAITLNDDEDLSDELREESLTELFKKVGVLLVFEG